MAEFWESNFKEKQEMWGLKPAKSAILSKDFFIKKNVKNILIPGVGYGRNAQIFKDNGFDVTGIEISKTAIELARKHYGTDMTIYHGSVIDMPFDSRKYEGIFCYALIHLMAKEEREKLILNCYNQLTENGYMVFTAITKEAPNFGKGKRISKDRYEFHEGAKLFYYDKESVQEEFGETGLFEITEINESQPFYLIKCKKGKTKL
ncbi:class I SAM-dependent methyltransferase [Galbibacter sp. EGI 63066]|uniref:class I SAM-dependent methyltransferase n=1 Tax=Galbibacter sp. EGI 63066 TaxID=2993559 RepID=UPI002248B96C|nr:class I SAM-dependent methyltransferase [Galbibacter sp. EGI 63066]MCX2678373.1 class I SAM-dependent methyltransferase [Galbibacter sp. EGI 63066]